MSSEANRAVQHIAMIADTLCKAYQLSLTAARENVDNIGNEKFQVMQTMEAYQNDLKKYISNLTQQCDGVNKITANTPNVATRIARGALAQLRLSNYDQYD